MDWEHLPAEHQQLREQRNQSTPGYFLVVKVDLVVKVEQTRQAWPSGTRSKLAAPKPDIILCDPSVLVHQNSHVGSSCVDQRRPAQASISARRSSIDDVHTHTGIPRSG